MIEAPDEVTQHRPHVAGDVGRYVEDRTGGDYKQAGEMYGAFDDRQRDDLINNLVRNLRKADPRIEKRMVWHFLHADEDYGTGANKPAPDAHRSPTDNVPGHTPTAS